MKKVGSFGSSGVINILFKSLYFSVLSYMMAMCCMAGERKERRRGKNKNGKYYDWKSLTQHTEQFQSEEKVLSSNDKMILLVLNFFSSIVWLICIHC